jgi:hypothetical protein
MVGLSSCVRISLRGGLFSAIENDSNVTLIRRKLHPTNFG